MRTRLCLAYLVIGLGLLPGCACHSAYTKDTAFEVIPTVYGRNPLVGTPTFIGNAVGAMPGLMLAAAVAPLHDDAFDVVMSSVALPGSVIGGAAMGTAFVIPALFFPEMPISYMDDFF